MNDDPTGRIWLGTRIFPVLSIGVLFIGIACAMGSIAAPHPKGILFSAFFIGLGLYMLSLVYRARAGGSTFGDRILTGFLYTGLILVAGGVIVLMFGQVGVSGVVPRLYGIEQIICGLALMMPSGALKFLLKLYRDNKNAPSKRLQAIGAKAPQPDL